MALLWRFDTRSFFVRFCSKFRGTLVDCLVTDIVQSRFALSLDFALNSFRSLSHFSFLAWLSCIVSLVYDRILRFFLRDRFSLGLKLNSLEFGLEEETTSALIRRFYGILAIFTVFLTRRLNLPSFVRSLYGRLIRRFYF